MLNLKKGYVLVVDDLDNAGCSNGNYPEWRLIDAGGNIVKSGVTCRCGRGCSDTDCIRDDYGVRDTVLEQYRGDARHYYAGYSYMGTNFTYDSPCWIAYRFDSKAERDKWVAENEYNDQGNRVSEAITQKIAYAIAGIKTNYKAEVDHDNRLMAVPR